MASSVTKFRHVRWAQAEQRQEPRHPASVISATVRQHSEDPTDATLHDLSLYGCRLRLETLHEAGERLWVRFRGGMPIAASVVWGENGFIGCRFDEPIERALLRALIGPPDFVDVPRRC